MEKELGSVIDDEVAFVEQGIEFRMKELTTGGKGRFGGHKGTSM